MEDMAAERAEEHAARRRERDALDCKRAELRDNVKAEDRALRCARCPPPSPPPFSHKLSHTHCVTHATARARRTHAAAARAATT